MSGCRDWTQITICCVLSKKSNPLIPMITIVCTFDFWGSKADCDYTNLNKQTGLCHKYTMTDPWASKNIPTQEGFVWIKNFTPGFTLRIWRRTNGQITVFGSMCNRTMSTWEKERAKEPPQNCKVHTFNYSTNKTNTSVLMNHPSG